MTLLLSLALLSVDGGALAATRMPIRHGDTVLLQARVPFERLLALVDESRFLESHPDGYDIMQVRELPTDELGDLARGQVWRAWTGPGRFTDCRVSRFVVELAFQSSEEVGEALPPPDHRSPAGTFAELDCEGSLDEAWLLVRPEDPVPFELEL